MDGSNTNFGPAYVGSQDAHMYIQQGISDPSFNHFEVHAPEMYGMGPYGLARHSSTYMPGSPAVGFVPDFVRFSDNSVQPVFSGSSPVRLLHPPFVQVNLAPQEVIPVCSAQGMPSAFPPGSVDVSDDRLIPQTPNVFPDRTFALSQSVGARPQQYLHQQQHFHFRHGSLSPLFVPQNFDVDTENSTEYIQRFNTERVPLNASWGGKPTYTVHKDRFAAADKELQTNAPTQSRLRTEPVDTVPAEPPSLHSGWIKKQLKEPSDFQPEDLQPAFVSAPNFGVRRDCLPSVQAYEYRANPVDARFRALYPLGFPPRQSPGDDPDPQHWSGAVQMQNRYSASTGHQNIRGRRSIPQAPAFVLTRAGDQTVYSGIGDHMVTSVDEGYYARMEHDATSQSPDLLSLKLSEGGIALTVGEKAVMFAKKTYRELGQKTYVVPRIEPNKPVNHDKKLIRTREAEFRLGHVLDRLSQTTGDALFVLVDSYKYENFLFHVHASSETPEPQAQVLMGMKTQRTIGNFDILAFHKQFGVLVFGLCAVNSDSDIQYILKRVLRTFNLWKKSTQIVEHLLTCLGIHCPVRPVFCAPNIKMSFLKKVLSRDKELDKLLPTWPVITSDILPAQFHTAWASNETFELCCKWWQETKDDWLKQGWPPVSKFHLAALIGCFLCPDLSKVEFDPRAASPVGFNDGREGSPTNPEEKAVTKDKPNQSIDVDTLNIPLKILNVTKPFSKQIEQYVELYYPDCVTKTYRVPPVHFNIQKLTPEKHYDLLEMPMSKDVRGDEGENRVVSTIEILGRKYSAVRPSFIICDFQYNNYLSKLKETMFVKGDDRRPIRAHGQMYRAQHDCLLVNRRYGIIVFFVKAVGDNFEEWAKDGTEMSEAVKRTLRKVLNQLPRERTMIRMVLHDLVPNLTLTKLIALPNLNRSDINTYISQDQDLKQEIEERFPGLGTEAFLCKDELCETGENIWDVMDQSQDFYQNLCRWWDRVVGPGQADVLTETQYKQIIGRFCGLLSTVEVWTPQQPKVEVRCLGEAVQETAERFARLALTPKMVELLQKDEQWLYIVGPPGSGKTQLLALRALHWLEEGRGPVVILNHHHGTPGLPLGHFLQAQLLSLLQGKPWQLFPPSVHGQDAVASAAAQNTVRVQSLASAAAQGQAGAFGVQRVDLDTRLFSEDKPGALAAIPEGAFVVVPEATPKVLLAIKWIKEQRKPSTIWCCGLELHCPEGFIPQPLTLVLRRPPMVQRILRILDNKEHYIHSSAPHGLPTDGPAPCLIFHSRHQPCGGRPPPSDCEQCGEELHSFFYSLSLKLGHMERARRKKLGPLPATTTDCLTLRDVAVISRLAEPCALVTALRKKELAVSIMSVSNPSVASMKQDCILFTTPQALTGLERKVVVFVPTEKPSPEVDMEGMEEDVFHITLALERLSEEDHASLRLAASCCLSQLVVIVP